MVRASNSAGMRSTRYLGTFHQYDLTCNNMILDVLSRPHLQTFARLQYELNVNEGSPWGTETRLARGPAVLYGCSCRSVKIVMNMSTCLARWAKSYPWVTMGKSNLKHPQPVLPIYASSLQGGTSPTARDIACPPPARNS